jgi:uncharacterized protein DUF3631/uncharacterized protein DUF3854
MDGTNIAQPDPRGKGGLLPADLQAIAKLGIPESLLEQNDITRVTDDEARALGFGGSGCLSGILYKHFHPLTDACRTYRLRLDFPPMENGKPKGKYLCLAGRQYLYFLRGCAEQLADASIPVVIVEAAKSVLAGAALAQRLGRSMMLIGCNGCWGWRGRIGKQDGPNGERLDEKGPLPDWNLVAWQGRDTVICFDSNYRQNPKVRAGCRALAQHLMSLGASVRIAVLPPGNWNGLDDYIGAVGDEVTGAMLDAAKKLQDVVRVDIERQFDELQANPEAKKQLPEEIITLIAQLANPIEREFMTAKLADIFKGALKKSTLVATVEDRAAKVDAEERVQQECRELARLCGLEVNPIELLSDLVAWITRFVRLSEAQAVVLAAWVLHTHAFAAARHTPYLNVTSPEKRSGKTRLFEALRDVSRRPWLTGYTSKACLVRKVHVLQPTLLFDESDAVFGGDKEFTEALRGVLNSGYSESGSYSMVVGEGTGMTWQDFKTFSAKAFAGIGKKLPDTVLDRAIPIQLKRRKPSESRPERYREDEVREEAARLRDRAAAWGASNSAKLRPMKPVMDERLNDRQQDVLEPLFAIVELAGGEWPGRLKKALLEICAGEAAGDESIGVRLLVDIRAAFESAGKNKLPTTDLLGHLKGVETSNWGDWDHGKGLNANGLARLLKGYEIYPRALRLDDGKVAKGYDWESFLDAFERYLPADPLSNRNSGYNSMFMRGPGTFPQRNIEPLVTGQKSKENPVNTRVVTAVTVQKPNNGHAEPSSSPIRPEYLSADGANRKCASPPTSPPKGKPPTTPPNGRLRI